MRSRRLVQIRRIREWLALSAAITLIPWTLYLGFTLPQSYTAQHWLATWVGFDVLLLTFMLVTAVLGFLRHHLLTMFAFSTGVLLLCDAWFDVMTARRGDFAVSVLTAVFGELPVAAVLVGGSLRIARLQLRPRDGARWWFPWRRIGPGGERPRWTRRLRTAVAGFARGEEDGLSRFGTVGGRDGRATIYLSEVLRSPVSSRSGEDVGCVNDVIVRLRDGEYPLVTGIVAEVGGREVFVGSNAIDEYASGRVVLSKNKVDLRGFERRDGEVLLRADVLGHRLIDVADVDLVRAYDAELQDSGAGWVLARLDIRRPSRLFGLIKRSGGHSTRDWKTFEPLIGHSNTDAVRRLSGGIGGFKPAEIADLLEDANKAEGGEILDRVHSDPELEADVFEELEPEKASRLLGDMQDGQVAALLGRMRADDAADAVADLRKSRRRRVLDLMPARQRAKVITLLGFNPESAGGLMNVDFVSCLSTAAPASALALIAQARVVQPEALIKVHVLDEDERLVGVVSVITLLQAEDDKTVGAVMDSDPVRVSADADLSDVALLMADFNLYGVPVVDERDHVLGVVTVDDVLQAVIPEDWRRREPAPRPAWTTPASSGRRTVSVPSSRTP